MYCQPSYPAEAEASVAEFTSGTGLLGAGARSLCRVVVARLVASRWVVPRGDACVVGEFCVVVFDVGGCGGGGSAATGVRVSKRRARIDLSAASVLAADFCWRTAPHSVSSPSE